MKIRAEQIDELGRVRLPDFEYEMVRHLDDFAPSHAAALGAEGLRPVVRLGIQRAAEHGFCMRASVRFYIETMFILGSDFDTDPQYPWAGKVLSAEAVGDELARADRLYEWLVDFSEEVGGPERSYVKAALHRGREEPLEPVSLNAPDFTAQMIGRLRRVFPEKCEYVGGDGLSALLVRAKEQAGRHNIDSDAGVAICVGLAFALGHGFADDPQYPWVRSTLTNAALRDDDVRTERLLSKSRTYLDHVLAFVEAP